MLDAARRLGVDLDSVCGGRGICGRCQVAVSVGEHAKHGIACTAEALTAATELEQRYAREHPLARGSAPRVYGMCRGRRRRRRPTREPGASPGRPQGGRRAHDRARPCRAPLPRRGRGAAARHGDERRDAAARGARARVGPRGSHRRSRAAEGSPARAAQGRVERHGRRARRGGGDRRLARLPRRRLRDRVRRRLDDGRRAPLRPRGAARSSPRRAR